MVTLLTWVDCQVPSDSPEPQPESVTVPVMAVPADFANVTPLPLGLTMVQFEMRLFGALVNEMLLSAEALTETVLFEMSETTDPVTFVRLPPLAKLMATDCGETNAIF